RGWREGRAGRGGGERAEGHVRDRAGCPVEDDSTGGAHPAGGARGDPTGRVRGCQRGRRGPVAPVLGPHPTVADALDHHGDHPAGHRRLPHLRHRAGAGGPLGARAVDLRVLRVLLRQPEHRGGGRHHSTAADRRVRGRVPGPGRATTGGDVSGARGIVWSLRGVGFYALAGLFAFMALVPLAILLKVSISGPEDVLVQHPPFWVHHPTFEHWAAILKPDALWPPLRKSLVVA